MVNSRWMDGWMGGNEREKKIVWYRTEMMIKDW